MDLKAIIFDMDGVIADTEFVDYGIQTAFVAQERKAAGLEPLEEHDAQGLMGLSYDALYQKLNELSGSACPVSRTRDRFAEFDATAREHLDYGALFRHGTVDILDWADERGIACAVASSSARAHIKEVLSACGVLERFVHLESGESLAESKPNPEIYLRALAHLGVRANETVAIEDSEHGIAAARAAGIFCIGYRETRVPLDQSAANELVDDMAGALQVLKQLV